MIEKSQQVLPLNSKQLKCMFSLPTPSARSTVNTLPGQLSVEKDDVTMDVIIMNSTLHSMLPVVGDLTFTMQK